MLNWALSFLFLAIGMALFGFGLIAGAVSGIAQIFAVMFLILFLGSFFLHMKNRTSPR